MKPVQPVRIGSFEIGADGKLTILAGPCVIESRELCMEVAGVLKDVCRKYGVNYVFKASFDKANRSSVESFRGVGMEDGLAILGDVKKQ